MKKPHMAAGRSRRLAALAMIIMMAPALQAAVNTTTPI